MTRGSGVNFTKIAFANKVEHVAYFKLKARNKVFHWYGDEI